MNLGIGVNIVWYDYEEKAIAMEAGIDLQLLVQTGMNHNRSLQEFIIYQLNRIEAMLFAYRIAHCDIKPANIILTASV